MIWLDAKHRYRLYRDEPDDHVIPWIVDVRAVPDWEVPGNESIDSFLIGRFLADEIRRFDVEAWGESVWEVADADSAGLVLAYAALTDADGNFRQEDFAGGIADPFVYLYDFAVHADFAAHKRAIVDGFCHLFGDEAAIVTGSWVNWMSLSEFESIGFNRWTPVEGRRENLLASGKFLDGGGDVTTFLVRDNALRTELDHVGFFDGDLPPATLQHEQWVEAEVAPR